MPRQFYEPVTFKALGTIATASQTTNHTGATACRYYKDMLLCLHVTTISGTTKTLNVHMEAKGPDGFWYDLPQGGTSPDKFAFTERTTTGMELRRVARPMGKEVRAVSVLSAMSRGRWQITGWGVQEE